MIAALFAMAVVWLATGWFACRTSRRAARLWAAAALSALATANAIQIVQMPGPWWPLLHWPHLHWMARAGEGIAATLWIAGLALVLRAWNRSFQAGLVILACGVAAFTFGLSAAVIDKVSSPGFPKEWGRACLGAPRSLDRWTATLRAVQPVVGPDYTGVQAQVDLRFADGVEAATRPERRDYLANDPGSLQGSQTLVRWNGELLVETVTNRNYPECAELVLEWQPFAQWLRYGAWASLAGALVLLAAALRGAWWRAGARRRIAMRRDDQGRGPMPTNPASMGWKPVVLALTCGVIAFVWQAGQRVPHHPGPHGEANGAAMIAARQRLFGGPHLTNRWLIIADALARHGQFGEAAQVLQGAVDKEPGNAEAWLALGDALYGHAGGSMVAAAELAYDRADRVAAPQTGSGSLVVRALASSGRDQAATDWVCRDSLRYRQCPD